MTCWSRLPALKNHRSFKAWLYGIAVNKCYEALRGRSKTQQTTSIDEVENMLVAGRGHRRSNCTARRNHAIARIAACRGSVT